MTKQTSWWPRSSSNRTSRDKIVVKYKAELGCTKGKTQALNTSESTVKSISGGWQEYSTNYHERESAWSTWAFIKEATKRLMETSLSLKVPSRESWLREWVRKPLKETLGKEETESFISLSSRGWPSRKVRHVLLRAVTGSSTKRKEMHC